MNRVEVFIIGKNEGTMLHKYSLLGIDDSEKDELTSGFLTALNKFAKEIGFPAGVSLIRSGSLEARFSSGDFIFTILIIDYQMPLGLESEPILSGMAREITELFEKKFHDSLVEGRDKHFYKTDEFRIFRQDIDDIINRFGAETFELYQKLILIESIYAKVPQKWCLPLLERISDGENVIDEFPKVIKKYPNMKRAIEKVNFTNKIIWEIFAIPIFEE